ncbi:hypothetical protein PHMEG_0008258 [Phytophthora megakarya]|uniref:Uncharacterized protein n=1 Tax=Phytophthora megakarya TaxID=4795 RepID=A0A225WKH9_9STRA|nr:hypothetical protein PHMEG_0008258 [Phytophthora megakarya]
MGSDLQLLFVVSSESQNSKLLEFYGSRDVDTNSRGDLCVDKFIDVLGRKKVETSSCKGFLEMNVLSPTLLQKVLVHEWHAEQQWVDEALATKRTKSFLQWKEAAKAARKERRKKEGQEKQQVREVKKREQEKVGAAKEADEQKDAELKLETTTETATEVANLKEEKAHEETKVKQEKVNVTSKQGQKRKQQPSGQKSKNKKRRNKKKVIE